MTRGPGTAWIGRRKPYTAIGISRIPCARCGAPSTQQWSICALDNRYLGCCDYCDTALNALVLYFFGVKGRRTIMARYRRRGG